MASFKSAINSYLLIQSWFVKFVLLYWWEINCDVIIMLRAIFHLFWWHHQVLNLIIKKKKNSPPGTIAHRIKIKPIYCPPGPRSLGLILTRTTPHQDHYQWLKPLIKTNIYMVGNCPDCGELSGYDYLYLGLCVWIEYNNFFIYTERQKKLITSSEWHSLKSTASKWFIFRHR